jgi:hypothetical protein
MEPTSETKQMGLFGRIAGIFVSPAETFHAVESKPSWWLPFVIIIIIAIGLQLWLMDITMKDQISVLEQRIDNPQQLEIIKARMQGPAKYLGLIAAPIVILIIWVITAALLILASNPILGGQASFGQIFGVVAWSSLVSSLGGILKSVLIFIQGTSQGVSTSLAAVLPVPPRGETPSVLYALLSKLDPFMIWQVILWGIGLAVVAKIDSKKGYTGAFGVWLLWVIVSVAFRKFFMNFG